MEPLDPDVVRSPGCSCHECPLYRRANLKTRLPHKTVAPTSSFSSLAGCATIATSQGGAASGIYKFQGLWPTVTSQPSLSWLVRPCKHCLYGPSPSSLQPLVWQFPGKNFWSGNCFSPPCSLLRSIKLQLPWHFCHVPNFSQSRPQALKDRKAFTGEYTNTSSPWKVSQPGNSLYPGWGNFLFRTTSPIMWEWISLCGHKRSSNEDRGLLFFLPCS